jgi:membrane protein DedA with SNARE-associated domain
LPGLAARKTYAGMSTTTTRRSARVKRAPRRRSTAKPDWAHRYRTPLLWLAAIRIAAGIVAIPLAAVLYREHFLLLVLMRPTKEVLLAAGFLARQGSVNILQILIAATPLAIVGVWHAFALGRGHTEEIRKGKLPGIGRRLLPVEKIKKAQKLLRTKGWKVIVIGRLAVFPSSIVGAAAGSSGVKTRDFLPPDTAGGLLSIASAVGAGYVLGDAYESGKRWLTLAGVVALAALAVLIGRFLRRET